MSQLTHINASGEANMVDVSNKADTVREARAEAYVRMAPETLQLILSGQHHKRGCVCHCAYCGHSSRETYVGAYSALSPVAAFQGGSTA